MTCKDCLYWERCHSRISYVMDYDEIGKETTDIENHCKGFVDKSRYVEVVHGEWIEKEIPLNWCEDDVEVVYRCSICDSPNWGETPYCPMCGARMDGADDGNVVS